MTLGHIFNSGIIDGLDLLWMLQRHHLRDWVLLECLSGHGLFFFGLLARGFGSVRCAFALDLDNTLHFLFLSLFTIHELLLEILLLLFIILFHFGKFVLGLGLLFVLFLSLVLGH